MSRICLGVVKLNKREEVDKIKDMLKGVFSKCGLNLYYSLVYIEPCISTQLYDKEKIVFSISDGSDYDNCEMFLLPDDSIYNEKNNKEPFYNRMLVLQGIFKEIYNVFDTIELFVGVSGDEKEDFEVKEVLINEFAFCSTEVLNVSIPPSVHFRLINDCKR